MGKDRKLPRKFFPADVLFDVQSFPLYWVARLNAKYSLAMEKQLKRVGMDVPRWRVGMMVRIHGELSISQIAEHAIGKLPTITKIVYRMQDEGLVVVKTSDQDGRVSLVSLTEKGHEAINGVTQATTGLFDGIYDGLSKEDLEQLMKTLRHMFQNLANQ